MCRPAHPCIAACHSTGLVLASERVMVSDAGRQSAPLLYPAGSSAIAGSRWWQPMLLSAQEKMMAKLTDTQLIVLSKAAQCDDGAASVPDRMNKAAAAKVAASLVARKLMREVRAKPGMPVWRV